MGLMASAELQVIKRLEQTPYYSIPTPPFTQFEREKVAGMGDIFTAFGNHEAKALAMLSLGLRDEATKYQLTSSLLRFIGNVWDIHSNTTESYLRTFRRFGDFAQAVQPPKGAERWRLTEKGAQVLPIAAYILVESYRYSVPLIFTFGPSTGPKEAQGSGNNLLILTDLATKDSPKSISILVQDTGIKYTTVNAAILQLANTGLLDHDSLTPEEGKGKIKYSVVEDKEVDEKALPKFKGKVPDLVEAIYRVTKQATTPLSVDDIVTIVETDESLDPRLKRFKQLRKVINNVLGALRSAGLLQSNLTAVTDQSHVFFKDDNHLRDFIREIVPAIIGYLEGDHQMVQKMSLAQSFLISQSEEAQFIRQALMARARATSFWSPDTIGVASDRVNDAYRFLLVNPNSRVAAIAKAINSSTPEAGTALLELISQQKVTRFRLGRGSYYSVVKDANK